MAATRRIRVGRVGAIFPGARIAIPTPLETVLVVNVNDEFYAVSNICPHAGGYLNHGPMEGYIIECPLHYWPFDVRNGKLVGFDDFDMSECLNSYPTIVEGDELFIEIPSDE